MNIKHIGLMDIRHILQFKVTSEQLKSSYAIHQVKALPKIQQLFFDRLHAADNHSQTLSS